MNTYGERLDAFHELNAKNRLTSSAQLVYLHLLHMTKDCLGEVGSIQVADRVLELRTGLAKKTITEAKRELKNRGLIDFHTDRNAPRNPTKYTFPLFSEKVGQKVGQNKNSERLDGLFAIPCARADDDAILYNKKNKIKNEEEEEERAHDSKNIINNKMSVHELWKFETGQQLTGSTAIELESLARTYGRDSFTFALIKAVQSKTTERLRFSYFKKILENMKEKDMKEGDNHDRPSTSKKLSTESTERHYSEPDTTNDPDDLYKYM